MIKDYFDINYGIQVIFSTIPNQGKNVFEQDIEKSYFTDYNEKLNDDNNFLYNPIKCYLMGDYDVCYITLINNFKFSHRLFESKDDNKDTIYNAHTFQSYSGYALNKKKELERIFTDNPTNYFVSIFNLKLNNGLLLGNGISYVKAVVDYIKSIIPDTPFIVMQTFSWFEISLIVFLDEPSQVSDILSKIRIAEFKNLKTTNLANSLYHSLIKGENKIDRINRTSLFADTQTYFGFNKDLIIEKPKDDPYVNEFKTKAKDINLNTEIEWHIKPGHIADLNNILREHKYLKVFFNKSQPKIVLGKSDYILQKKENSILFNFYLIRYIHRNDSNGLFKHIRKVRSFVYFNASEAIKDSLLHDSAFLWEDVLKKLAVKKTDFNLIDIALKSLNISRQVRMKVLKIFSNYNHGIQDPILFPYFLDFRIFVFNLINLIKHDAKQAEKKSYNIRDFESKLDKHIKAFQEGYSVRFLNGYKFENISSFSLDFNGSIQLLLTSYSSLVYEYSKLFYNEKEKNNDDFESDYSPIIQLNNIDTTSNYLTINYSIHHLTSPEFVITTILKEILNHLSIDNDNVKSILANFTKSIPKLKSEINESYLDDMFDAGLIDMSYFIIDSIRYVITFNSNFLLFEHWFWSYNFQNSSLFNSTGMFNENHLKKEMLRIMLINKFFKSKHNPKNPSPEIFTYWDRHIVKISILADKLLKKIKLEDFEKVISSIVNSYLLHFENLENFDYMVYQDKFEYPSIISLSTFQCFVNRIGFLFQKNESDNPIHNLDKLFFSLINKQFDKNKNRMTSLKRDWKDGTILKRHDMLYDDILYAIDATGGVYFHNSDKTEEYFKLNAKYISGIIDTSYKYKKQFILNILDE